MLVAILRFLYVLAFVALLSYFWGLFVSIETQNWFGIGLLSLVLAYYMWNAQRLMNDMLSDNVSVKNRGLGIWREIFYLFQKNTKKWRGKVADVERQQDRFIQAIQASPNGILMLDELDQIEWCNRVSERHFGLDSKRDLRQKVTHLIRQPGFVHYLAQGYWDQPLSLEDMGINRNLSLLIQSFPYGENRKLILSQDVTQAKKSEAMRQDFVANVSHELRTPLTVLSGFLETVLELELSPEDHKKYLGLMHQQSERMKALVEDLLILTRLESTMMPRHSQLISAPALIHRLVEDAKNLSGGAHQFEVDIDEKAYLEGEESELFSAFGNLITNAVRYTPSGGNIKVSWQVDKATGLVEFSVVDSGGGIAPEHIPRLTERFYRVDRSRSRDTGGTGLGLAIVKHVTTRHGATLKIDSELGRGSRFAITFPASRLIIQP